MTIEDKPPTSLHTQNKRRNIYLAVTQMFSSIGAGNHVVFFLHIFHSLFPSSQMFNLQHRIMTNKMEISAESKYL